MPTLHMGLPPGVIIGVCCICGEDPALVMYCGRCEAWICGICRRDWPRRLWAAFEAWRTGRTGVCGQGER